MGTQTDLYDLRLIGHRIRRCREEKHISQEQLANNAGLAIGTIGKIERGINNPKAYTLIRIARELGVPCRSFFDQPDSRKKHFSPQASRLFRYMKYMDEYEIRILCLIAEAFITHNKRACKDQ